MGFLWFNDKQSSNKEELINTATEEGIQKHLDIAELDESLKSLQKSAESVSREAIDAANYLEKELELTKYRFFSVIDSMIDMVIIKNAEHEWITSNTYANKLFDFKLSDYYKKSNCQIAKLPWISKEEFLADNDSDELAWERGDSIKLVQEFTCYDGKVHYFDIIKTPTYYDDACKEPKELIIIGRDITRLHNTREYNNVLVNALNYASDMIVITDVNGNIIYSNNAFSDVYGYKLDDILGHPISILKSGTCDPSIYSEIWEVVTTNTTWEGELTNAASNGELIDINLNIIPIMNGLPHPINYICVMKRR